MHKIKVTIEDNGNWKGQWKGEKMRNDDVVSDVVKRRYDG